MLVEIFCSFASIVAPTDTLHLSRERADEMFVRENLVALASEYHVEASQALEIQARLYPNPVLSAELNVADPQNKEYFHAGRTGQKQFGIDQLIVLGGKRRTEIALSKQNSMIARLELEDLVRNLSYELHSNFYGVYFNQLAVRKFDQQLALLDSIITSYDVQAKKGNIPFKDVIRLKSVYIRINNEKTQFVNEILAQQSKLQVLLQSRSYIAPEFDTTRWSHFEIKYPLDSLIEEALDRRPDFKVSIAQSNYASLNIQYQRRLAVPNLNLGAAYDQRGGAFLNQVGLTLAMPLPISNRNQGNIRFSEYQLKSLEVHKQQVRSSVIADVTNAWLALNRNIDEYRRAQLLYNADFSVVFTGISDNFQRRNVTLLEFVDFFESYNETLINMNHIERQVAVSAELLNYQVAYPLY